MKYRYPFATMQELITKVHGLLGEPSDDPDDQTVNALVDTVYAIGHDRLQLEELLAERRVKGRCPMGCGETLYLAVKGIVECSSATCDEPGAVTALLLGGETEHLVQFDEDDFSCLHPLRERLDHQLLTCGISDAVKIMIDHKVPHRQGLGTYRVMPSPIGPGRWSWERLD